MKSLAGFQGRALNGVLRGRDHPKMLTLHYVALQHFREPEKPLSPRRVMAIHLKMYRLI